MKIRFGIRMNRYHRRLLIKSSIVLNFYPISTIKQNQSKQRHYHRMEIVQFHQQPLLHRQQHQQQIINFPRTAQLLRANRILCFVQNFVSFFSLSLLCLLFQSNV